MITYLLESTFILAVTYGFYYLFLRQLKTFAFNRFYLLFSLFFAVLIPLLDIRVGFSAPVAQGLNGLGYATGQLIQGDVNVASTHATFSIIQLVILLYGLISAIFLLRFLVNVVRIIRKTRGSVSVSELNARVCMVEEPTLPYSFFRRIVVNREEYQDQQIDLKLLLHEQAHCSQYHSADILLIELLKAVAWFNPFVWMFKKAIQTNHEFLADQSVLARSKPEPYLKVLVNLTIRNNSTYLASDFSYSLTKKRLLMMTHKNSRDHSTIKRFAALPLFILLAVTITFSQEAKSLESAPLESAPEETVSSDKNDWWRPILEKHKIEITAYNNFEYVFEMGSSNSIKDGVVSLEDAFFLVLKEDDAYAIIRSPKAFHDLKTNIIEGAEGIMEVYEPLKNGIEPVSSLKMRNFKYQVSGQDSSWEAHNVEGTFNMPK